MEKITILTYFLVFSGGILSFFSPCVIPLIPIYMSYLSGSAKKVDENGHVTYVQKKVFLNTMFFVFGICAAFFILGLSFTTLGDFLVDNKERFSKIGGVLIIMLGLFQLGVIKSKSLQKEFKYHNKIRKMSPLVAFITGFTFSFAWSPCVGPLLSAVLILASGSESKILGNVLVFVYSMGFVIPFLLLGSFTTVVLNFLRRNQYLLRYCVKLGGIILILMGVLTFTGKMESVSNYFSSPLGFLETKVYAKSSAPKAPDINLLTANGKGYDLKDYRGKVVFLNFFTTWCIYCQEELPVLNRLYKKFGENKEDIIFLGIMNPKTEKYPNSRDESVEKVKKYLKDKKQQIPTALDATGESFKIYRVNSYPTNVIVGKDGRIFKYIPGAMDEKELENYIKEAIKEN
ncbi:redoxin family protein [Cetobacterium sp. 8H]|uniref:cytochrome c biogenesis protein/redoxin n=1 Tax=Cetobacterium sp. 8H TaxID=2759681 RepID=UPI00163D2081|nr:cytochrome c biogenesis protein/redoxin [Cetobacterium sp. 8H]MBC2851441.1 redoxin family protein [Cetobacterium sp. 8H]